MSSRDIATLRADVESLAVELKAATTRPAICTDEHLEFLDRLRASGRTNMYGASPYLQTEFALDKNEARDVLRYWMDSFTERRGAANETDARTADGGDMSETNGGACTCDTCVGYCEQLPGWFLPRELKPLAAFLGMSERAVFREFLGANYWIGDAMTSYETVWVVAPATSNMLPGNEYPYRPFGRCVFLTDKGRCRVHEVRPYECRQAHHGGDEKHSADTRHKIVKAWAKQQPRVEKLAGRELFEPDGNYFDLMFD